MKITKTDSVAELQMGLLIGASGMRANPGGPVDFGSYSI